MANPYPHYAWAGGHFVLLLAALRYFVACITFKAGSYGVYYKIAFLGGIISYSIVVYKSLGTPQPNPAWFRRSLADENFQYFLLSLYWIWASPVPLALIPYATFSLFHVLTFTRTNIIPKLFPVAPAPGQSERAAQHPIAKTLHAWVKANYDPAMRWVAWAELAILARVVLGAVFGFIPYLSSRLPFTNSILAPFLFVNFLRLRYFHSAFTRQVLFTTDATINNFVNKPETHPQVKRLWEVTRATLVRFGSSAVMEPQPAAGAGAARR